MSRFRSLEVHLKKLAHFKFYFALLVILYFESKACFKNAPVNGLMTEALSQHSRAPIRPNARAVWFVFSPKPWSLKAGVLTTFAGSSLPECSRPWVPVSRPLPAPLLGQRVQPASSRLCPVLLSHPRAWPREELSSSTAHQRLGLLPGSELF